MTHDYNEWLKNGQPKIFCKCGCGKEIIIQYYYRYYDIPEYILGHNNTGKKQSPEHIRKKSEAQMGDKNPAKNPIVRAKISKTLKESGVCKGENNPNWKEKIKKVCIKCNKEFDVVPYLDKIQKYCSKECGCSHVGIDNPAWNGGTSFLPYCEQFNEKKREEIRNQYNRKCYLCGKDEKDNITKNNKVHKLSVHHIDEDKEQGCNGKPWKLVPLCMHCHSKVKNIK